jgi:hypothetical protein
MSIKDFVENYPLHKPYTFKKEYKNTGSLPKPAINMKCDLCNSKQTFNMINEYYSSEKHPASSIKNDVHRQYINALVVKYSEESSSTT